MPEPLDVALADAYSALRRVEPASATVRIDFVRALLDDIRDAAEDFVTFLNEADARLWSGLAADTLRKKFPGWSELGHARLDEKGHRTYRRAVLPRRANLEAARKAAKRAVEGDAA